MATNSSRVRAFGKVTPTSNVRQAMYGSISESGHANGSVVPHNITLPSQPLSYQAAGGYVGHSLFVFTSTARSVPTPRPPTTFAKVTSWISSSSSSLSATAVPPPSTPLSSTTSHISSPSMYDSEATKQVPWSSTADAPPASITSPTTRPHHPSQSSTEPPPTQQPATPTPTPLPARQANLPSIPFFAALSAVSAVIIVLALSGLFYLCRSLRSDKILRRGWPHFLPRSPRYTPMTRIQESTATPLSIARPIPRSSDSDLFPGSDGTHTQPLITNSVWDSEQSTALQDNDVQYASGHFVNEEGPHLLSRANL